MTRTRKLRCLAAAWAITAAFACPAAETRARADSDATWISGETANLEIQDAEALSHGFLSGVQGDKMRAGAATRVVETHRVACVRAEARAPGSHEDSAVAWPQCRPDGGPASTQFHSAR